MTKIDHSPIPDFSALLRLDGRSFIVVGAGQGIGRQAAHALASQGGKVLCVDIDPVLAENVANEIGGVPATADVRNGDQVAGLVQTALGEFGRLDGVADVVGASRWAAIVDMPEEDWEWCHDINLRHAFHLTQHAGRVMAERGGGSLVFIASISGITSAPFHGAYGVFKAGLISLVRTAAVELKSKQVRINAIAPGGVATPRLAAARRANPDELADGSLEGFAATWDIASSILFLSSDLSRHITGQTLTVDGGSLLRYPVDINEPAMPPGRSLHDDADGSAPDFIAPHHPGLG